MLNECNNRSNIAVNHIETDVRSASKIRCINAEISGAPLTGGAPPLQLRGCASSLRQVAPCLKNRVNSASPAQPPPTAFYPRLPFSRRKQSVMAEAIAAFGLAANVIQFIDVGSPSRQTCGASIRGKGLLPTTMLDVDSINFDLQQILLGLDNGSTESPATADRCLVRLAKECRNSANMLDNKLRPLLKVRSQARVKERGFQRCASLNLERG